MTRMLEDKIIIVTGAGSGMGAAAVRIFAREGAHVVAVGRTASKLPLEREQKGDIPAVLPVVADVSKGDDVQRLVETTVARFGRLDGAFNNAAIDGIIAKTADYPEEEWDQVIAINLKGAWNCMRYQIPAMLASGGGAIVNNASSLSEVGQFSMPAYCASKAGLVGLTKAAALDYADVGIRVNALSPGVVKTPMLQIQIDANPRIRDILVSRQAIGRLGVPDVLADAAAWMLSDRASFMVGANVAVDGGYLAL